MSENFRDYLVALSEDPELLKRFKADRSETLKDARISREERDALRNGDRARINSLLSGQTVPQKVRDLVNDISRAAS